MKILVSSCLLGEDVRYDGNNSSIALNPKVSFSLKELFMDILCDNEIYSFCPEVAGGLPIPRTPAEIVKRDKPDYDQLTFTNPRLRRSEDCLEHQQHNQHENDQIIAPFLQKIEICLRAKKRNNTAAEQPHENHHPTVGNRLRFPGRF